ncbi:MAG: FAD-dependent oxidoreductase [Balneolaceae bacterium]
MSETETFDVLILGAGIAGLSAADALIQNNTRCAVIDVNEPGSGTSGAPLMLLNPATGRRAKMAWRVEECMKASMEILGRVQKETRKPFFEANGVIRPALTPELAEDFQRSPQKYDWPDSDWVQWLDKETFNQKYPVFKNHSGGLVVKNGATVNGAVYMQSLSNYLVDRGVKTFYNCSYTLERTQSGWGIILADGKILTSKKVLFATGHAIDQSSYWSFLPVHCVKGQTATFHFKKSLPLESSVSSLGYIAYMPEYPDKLVAGSTYEHHYENLEPDEQGLNYLKKKMENVLPGLAEEAESTEQWAGVRVTTSDRHPVLGEHPEQEGLYVFTALGSKGLITARYAAEILADHIVSRKDVDDELTVKRFIK